MKMTGLACVVFNAICGAPIDEDADDVGCCDSREPQAIALSAMAMIRTYLIELQAPIIAPRGSARASHAPGGSRRSGERGRVSGSPRGEAPRIKKEGPDAGALSQEPVRLDAAVLQA